MSSLGIILNPVLYEEYHCAILSAEQDQGIMQFSFPQLKHFLTINVNSFGDICNCLTSYWGSIMRLDGIELDCQISSDKPKKRIYLIFDWDFERLETRVTRLGYLLNQRAVLILPKGGQKLRRYVLHGNGLTFSPCVKERDYVQIYDAIHYYFRYIYQSSIRELIDYKENRRFYYSNVMGKGCMNTIGRRVDKQLAKIKIGQRFEIKEEN